MKSFNCVLFIPLLFTSTLSLAEIGEIKNASWQTVPNTFDSENEDSDYLDVNGVTRQNNIVMFDLVTSNAAYERVQINCDSHKLRATRQGFFESKTRINYSDEPSNSWINASGSYKQALLKFACNLAENNEPMEDYGEEAGCDSPVEFFQYCNNGKIFSHKVIMYKDGKLFAKAVYKGKAIKVGVYIPIIQSDTDNDGIVSGMRNYSDATFKFLMKFLAKPHSVQPLTDKPAIGNNIPVKIVNNAGESLYKLIDRIEYVELQQQRARGRHIER